MAYQEPNVLIHQILEPAPVATPREQPAHIAAPYAHLGRYTDDDEKPDVEIGLYNDSVDACEEWPGIPDGAIPDQTYTRVFVDDALLRYFTSALNIATVANKLNEVKATNVNFKGNGDDYPLDAVFEDRDVQLGDVVRVRAVVGGEEYILWSYVAGFVADQVASTRGLATADDANDDTQILPTVVVTKTAGDENCVEVAATSTASYNGIVDGDINETYRVRVVESSVDGDATTARLYVTSASGNDDVGEITPSAFGVATAIGSRGFTVTFDLAEDGCSSSAEEDGIAPNDFLAGMEWTFSCGMAYTAPVLASGGTYTGDVDTIYVIEVTSGGKFASGPKPQITVTTVAGGDRSGPTTVTASAAATAVGTEGVTIAFTGDQLSKGDLFYIPVTAAKDGDIKTLKLGHNFHQDVLDNGATDVSLSLYIRENIEVPRLREASPPEVNWTQSETEICIKSGMTVYSSSWANGEEALPVFSSSDLDYGKVYVHYRAWLPTFCNGVYTLETIGEIDTVIPGPNTPDNPLKYAVYWAKLLSGGVPVRFTGICEPDDLESWTAALDYMENRRDIYGLVPVTRDAEVLAAWYGHINEQSSAQIGCRRVGWFSLSIPETAVVLDATLSSDEEEVLAVVEDDPDTSGTQYTIVRVPGQNARFVTRGVRAGDIVRLLYTSDAFERETYTERTVDAVINQSTLRLSTSLGAPVNTARKIEVWRNLDAVGKVEKIIEAKAYDDRRIMNVLPDSFNVGDEEIDGLFLTAALAGLASGVEPHQALTRFPINGITSVPKMNEFKRSLLNQLADAGIWLVIEDKQDGTVMTRHGLTSVTRDDANYREEQITRNLDNISFQTYDLLKPYLGVANNVRKSRDFMTADLQGLYQSLTTRITNALLGPQLVELIELKVEAHPLLKNNVEITTRLDMPYAINEINDYMII